jgi:hypothetical protein
VRIFTTPDTYVFPDRYLSIPRSFHSRPYARPSGCVCNPQSPQNPNRGSSGNHYPLSIATPVPEGPLTNEKVNHIIERLQHIILNNGGGLSPNGGAGRQLRPIPPAGGPHPPPPNAYGTVMGVDTCTTGGDTAGCNRLPWGRGDGYGYYGGGDEYGGHPAQGYEGGNGMGHAAYGAAGVGVWVGAGPSSDLEDQLLGTYCRRL